MGLLKPIPIAFLVIIVMLLTMIGGNKTTSTHSVEIIDRGVLSVSTSTHRSFGLSPLTYYLDAKFEDGEVIRVFSDKNIPYSSKLATIVVENQYSVFGYVSRRTLKEIHEY